MDLTFVALDLELTGLERDNERIIEIAALKFRHRRILEAWCTLVNPQGAVPQRIRELTGIAQADLDRAPVLAEVAGALIDFVQDHPIVGHSVGQDLACLQQQGITLANLPLDTFELASILLPQLPDYSLAALAKHLGIQVRESHRAADDALAAKELFELLVERAMHLDLALLQEINRLAAKAPWPLGQLFREVERQKSRTIFSTSSGRQQLAAKAGLEEANLDRVLIVSHEAEALRPHAPRRTVHAEDLAALLEPGGLLAQNFPGYEYRPQQAAMMRAVAQAFNQQENLLVEAGTGVGKSIAYLLPSIAFALQNNERVVISTQTITLQDQLFHKDIPDLQRLWPMPFKAAVLKGRTNYLCLWRYAGERRREQLSPEELSALVKVLVWLPTTATGDWAELNLTPAERAFWPRLTTTQETCLGTQCPHFRQNACFLYHARQSSASAHLVVVNHALLLSDIGASHQVLPEYRYLIVDEAHRLEEEATEQLGYRVSQRQLEAFLEELGGAQAPPHSGFLAGLKARLRARRVPAPAQRSVEAGVAELLERFLPAAHTANSEFFAVAHAFLRSYSPPDAEYGPRLRLTAEVRRRPDWPAVEAAWERLSLRLADIQRGLEKLQTVFAALAEAEVEDYQQLMLELTNYLGTLDNLRRQLNAGIAMPLAAMVYWLEGGAGSRESELTLHAAPLCVGDILREALFAAQEATVLTSATLTAAGSFAYVKDRLGLAGAKELLMDSPFDYARAALVYTPRDLPEPGRPGHQHAVEQALVELCRATQGRALILFTSRRQLATTFHAIRKPLEQEGMVVLAQGFERASRRQMLRSFRDSARAILLGTASFWEGIDVVGEALSVLVIVKLPFPVPTDPIFAARSELFAEPFNQYAVPQTVLRFRQGFGRLIRSQADRGVLVVLDQRIQSKPYGAAFLRSLPSCTIRIGPVRELPQEAVAWLSAK